jgi:hypothetical protein
LAQITLTTPWRRMILQSLHIFLTEALTFKVLFLSLLQTFDYSASTRVFRDDLDLDPVPGEESQMVTADTPRPVGQDFVPILQRYPEEGIRQWLHDRP